MDTQFLPFSSSIKEHLKTHLHTISIESEKIMKRLDCEEHCILCDFEDLQKTFQEIQSVAASYYLQRYLSPYTQNYIALSLAVHHLSEKRHGALMVIERKQVVDSLIQRGVPVGATLSATLLETIFYPGNPLHDGAVLIRGNEIVSASNVLPLSAQSIKNKKIGTRHRAAIGMSEQSDALVLVVSEETGRISFGLDGSLYPIHSSKNTFN
ncbi:sporulation-specific diadenylate cyclase CdaS [Bacillus sp. CGMCC 1.16541]|uniref:sporulation-specific diadenylate cyclase CdaS n=1 Tax=Bacillus sp. CGMCC 1.16541 TaxID=2185143 RepID=UPI000D7294A9|nr:sporulation-specific diadenylate cyclase CdaS [Bacillus sp. CGMCC 1.16541]